MLVLSRKIDQRIRIGNDIEIVVLAIEGAQVKLGIQAPREVHVLRCELLDDVREENRRAAAAAAVPVPLGSPFRGIASRAAGQEPASPVEGRLTTSQDRRG